MSAAEDIQQSLRYFLSNRTTAWQAMLRFSPKLSTFSCVLACTIMNMLITCLQGSKQFLFMSEGSPGSC